MILYLTGGELFTIGVYRHQKCDLPVSGNAVGKQTKTSAASSSHDGSSAVSTLEKVLCIDGEEVLQIASGTEHSALVTGKKLSKGWKCAHKKKSTTELTNFCGLLIRERISLHLGLGRAWTTWFR